MRSLEEVRQELIHEVRKKNNTEVIQEEMAMTFSMRRLETVTGSPAADDFEQRRPALFSEAEIKAEFRRITTIPLEQTFMYKLDYYTPKLISLMKAKGGVLGTTLRPLLDGQCQPGSGVAPLWSAIQVALPPVSTTKRRRVDNVEVADIVKEKDRSFNEAWTEMEGEQRRPGRARQERLLTEERRDREALEREESPQRDGCSRGEEI
ncbi:hypothetical protein EYF80_036583 [Liparis tanakae]|uniref:Uncharacterized protein n=1 Tax=Liparis tanakae TaxID=230148 RepID=A0A4Z2GKG7_9TELE|nr:hypothetical protein EYF80_036583 [Liparis tanakae]